MTVADVKEISDTEIIYKGVRFIADPNTPNRISIYLIKDNHSTLEVHGTTADEIVSHAKQLLAQHSDANCGIIFLMHNRKEISRRFFFIDGTGPALCSRDKSLTELLTMEDTKDLLTTNPKLEAH